MISLKVVPTASIIFGDRFREDYGDISMLIESMKKEGIIQPLAVRDNGDDSYALLAGGRRYTAARAADIQEVPVRCYPATLSELEMRSIELMENVCRKDLEWHESAKLKKQIYLLQVALYGEKLSTNPDAPGVSKRDVADLIGVSHSSLIQGVRMADAIEAFPELTQAKNSHEATKLFAKMQENIVKEELARRIEAKSASTPIERVRNNLYNAFIIDSFFNGVANIPNGSIDFIEVDPPYAIELNQ
jgi:ParB/RepB/Spo0J family partition protein